MENWAGVTEVPTGRFFDKSALTASGAGGIAEAKDNKKVAVYIHTVTQVLNRDKPNVFKGTAFSDNSLVPEYGPPY